MKRPTQPQTTDPLIFQPSDRRSDAITITLLRFHLRENVDLNIEKHSTVKLPTYYRHFVTTVSFLGPLTYNLIPFPDHLHVTVLP